MMNRKISSFITLSSLAGVLFFTVYTYTLVKTALEISPTTDDIIYELMALVFMIPLLVPAVFGLLYFRKRPGHWTKTVFTYFLLYDVALVLASIILFWPSNDPLAVGLPLVVLILPACVILSVLMLVRLLTAEPTL